MKMLKKSVAILLAAMLLIGSMSVLSFAAFDDGEETTVSFDTLFFRQENGEWVQTTKAEPGEVIRVRFVIKTDYKVGFAQTLYAFDKGFFESTAANKQISEFVSGDDWEAPMNANNPIVSALGIGGNYSPDHPVSYLMDGWPVEIPQADQQNLQFVSFKMFRPNVSADARVYDSDEWMYEIELTVRDDVQPGATATVAAYQPHYQTEDNYDAFASVGRMVDNGNGSYSNVAAGDWTYYEVTDSDVQYVWNDTDANSTLSIESTVTFNGNGGTIGGAATATATGVVGTAIGNQAPAADPVQEGKNFLGWSTDPEATGDDDLLDTADLANETFPYTDDVVYYAIYEDADASITLNLYVQNADGTWPATPTTSNPGAATGAVVTVSAAGVTSVDSGETTTYYTAPEHFSIDTTQSDASVTVVAGAANPVNVYVARDQYTVTFDGTGSPAYYEASGNAPAAAAREGYEFDKWVNAADSTDTLAEDAAYTVTGDKAYTSVYLPVSTEDNLTVVHQIYNDLANGGTPVDTTTTFNFVSDRNVVIVETAPSEGEGAANTDYITFAELFDIMAATDDHYEYDPDNSGNVLSGTVDPEDGLDLYLYYMPKEYTVTFQYAANDVASSVTDQYYTTISNIPTGRNVDGYNFLGWKLGDTLVTTSDTVTITGDATYTAEYEPIERTVHYEYVNAPDGVTQLADDTGIIGDAFDVPDYSSWEDRYTVTILVEDDEGELFDYVIGTSDVTVTITFEANPFIITYYDNARDASPAYVDDVEVTYGTALPAENMLTTLNGTAFKKAGKHFDGWEYYANGVQLDPLPASMPNNNINAYAVWTDIAYVVTVEGLDGEDLGYNQSYGYGEVVDLPSDADMEIPGYTFDGWNYDPSDILNADNRIIKDYDTETEVDLTISAIYTPISLTVRFDADGGTVNGQPYVDVSGLTVDQDIPTASIPAAPVRPGYHLDEDLTAPEDIWNVQGILDHDEIFNGTPEGIAMVYTPDWIPNEVTVNFDAQGGTFVAPLPEGAVAGDGVVSITGDADDAMTAPTVAQNGFNFLYWSDEPNGASYDVSKIPAIDDASITLYAVWSANAFAVNYEYIYENVKEADKLVAPASATVNFGEDLPSLAPATKDGYTVTEWKFYDANNTEITDGKMPAGNVTAKATQSGIPYSLTYAVSGTAPADFVLPTDNADYYIGDNATLATVTVPDGYVFDGWKLNGENAATVTFNTSDIEVTGVWSKTPYSVTYEYTYENVKPADQLAAPAATTLTVGDDLPTVAAATKDGYTVTGWTYYDGSNTEITDGKMPAGPVIAKATQSGIPYKLTYAVTGTAPADFVLPTDNTDYYIGDVATLAAVTAPDGYVFDGWKLNGEDAATVTFNTSDIEVTGVWSKTPYSVTYEYTYENVKVADQLAAPAATTLTVGDDLPTVAAATKDGYTVTGWTYYDANNTEITDGKMPAGNVTAKATQSGIAYSLNYNVLNDTLPEGFVRPTDDNDYYIGDTVNLVTVTVPDGYEFSGWKIDDEPVSSVTFETSDIEVVGELTKIPYTLTYEYTYENVKAADQLAAPAATTLTVGDDLPTVAAATKDGYTVTGWTYYDANNTEITDGKMPAGNVTAKATQSGIAYSLTYTVTGVAPASFVAPTDNADYYIGDTVTLATVAPVEGYTFSGWKLNGADATTVTFETSDIEVTGVWTINSWTADFLDVDGTRLATDTFNYGATITNKPADPENFGYEFGGWVDSTTYGEPTTFTAGMTMPDHDVAFKLVMTPIDYLVTFVKDGETVYSEELPYDSEIPEPEVNTDKTGYDFIGWFDADDNEYLPGTTVPGEVTYTAVYEGLPVNYSIVKNFQDADWDTPAGTDYVAAPATTATATAGSTVNVDFDAYDVEDGFTLDRTVSDATAEIAGDGSTVVNLYYTRNTVTGTIDGVEDTYYVGQTIASAEVQNPDPGLNYTGWEDADTEQAVSFPYTVPDRDFVLDPVSEPNVFTLTFVDEDGETVIGEPQQVAYGAQLAEYKPADPEKDGYEFSGWSDVDTGEQLPETMPAKNATYKAVYRADSNMSYTITVYVMDVAGNYTSTSTTAYGATGSPVTIQPGNMVGYAVNYESSHLSDFIAGDGTTELTIYYDLAAYEVTFFNEGGETAYDGPTEVLYGATIPVPATAPEKEGYNFVKWVDAEENDVPATMPAGAQSFYPVFAKAEYTITFIVNGAQTVVTYEFEDEVAVPENPVIDGMTFQGWTPEIPETMPAENLIIVAEFDKAAYTVNFVDYDGTPILTSLVDVGTPIGTPSTNPSREYYNFTGWDGYTAGMTMPAQDVTFTATYERVPVKLIPAEGSTTVIERLVGGEAVIESYNDDSVTTDGYAAEDFTGWYVYGLDEMINEQDLLNDYLAVQGDGSISIEPFSGKRGFYGTGATVTVTDNVTNEVVETFTIIVFGDLNGDAYITSDDTMMMRSELSGDTFWSDDLDEEYNAARTRAADLNGDGFVATNDRSILYNATLGTILLDQTTGLVATD